VAVVWWALALVAVLVLILAVLVFWPYRRLPPVVDLPEAVTQVKARWAAIEAQGAAAGAAFDETWSEREAAAAVSLLLADSGPRLGDPRVRLRSQKAEISFALRLGPFRMPIYAALAVRATEPQVPELTGLRVGLIPIPAGIRRSVNAQLQQDAATSSGDLSEMRIAISDGSIRLRSAAG
jgi:hypothetical protein